MLLGGGGVESEKERRVGFILLLASFHKKNVLLLRASQRPEIMRSALVDLDLQEACRVLRIRMNPTQQ